MSGDLGSPGLGLSEEDRGVLTREVHYIVHSAASISFVDHIHNLISHNYIVSACALLQLSRWHALRLETLPGTPLQTCNTERGSEAEASLPISDSGVSLHRSQAPK